MVVVALVGAGNAVIGSLSASAAAGGLGEVADHVRPYRADIGLGDDVVWEGIAHQVAVAQRVYRRRILDGRVEQAKIASPERRDGDRIGFGRRRSQLVPSKPKKANVLLCPS